MEQLPEKLPSSPMPLLCKWLEDAKADGTLPNPDAMTLATVSAAGEPSARIVLCRGVTAEPGYLVFYTNYESAKASDMESTGRAAAVFHWDHMNRQARVEGRICRSPEEESDRYFAGRDKESQIGAWASAQSSPIGTRQELLNKHVATARKLAGLQEESGRTAIPRPSFWGGYRLWIEAVELWCRGEARFHDRGRWTRQVSLGARPPACGPWSSTRLQP